MNINTSFAMIKNLLVFAFVFSSFSVLGQHDESRHSHVFVNIGAAFPIGGFRELGYSQVEFTTDKLPAFASNGTLLNVGFSHNLSKYFQAGATLGWRSNPIDEDAYAERFITNPWAYPDAPYTLKSNPWQSFYGTLDLYTQLPLHRFTPYLKGSVGVGAFTMGEANAVMKYEDYNVRINRFSDTKATVVYGGAVGLKYNLGPFDMNLECGVLAASAEFDYDIGAPTGIKQKYNLNTVNTTLGLSYRIYQRVKGS
ncbi:outer membrane beta-barrel protein [Pontibacter sp. 172403-2]|uniref:outer membrane beta-barrel protein n=1 Tax=Pontibacter rufus TaxID=2791028 RepID=UPI0018AFA616|nr:outer membrane beta-barrel protein [Pontibacter sp. 172403-2]MBF9254845.1 outer membrane beta-barrel protein [Pontibacter sp. 172403-2]